MYSRIKEEVHFGDERKQSSLLHLASSESGVRDKYDQSEARPACVSSQHLFGFLNCTSLEYNSKIADLRELLWRHVDKNGAYILLVYYCKRHSQFDALFDFFPHAQEGPREVGGGPKRPKEEAAHNT